MTKNGLVTDGEGWFVVNARESRWRDEGPLGTYCTFEGKRRFPHFGINISVLGPGQKIGMYHREDAQEAFLVLAGECTLIVDGQERPLLDLGLLLLRSRDRAHDRGEERPGGRRACGRRSRTRRRRRLVYKVCKAAAKYGASVARETTKPAQAYAEIFAKLPRSRFVRYRPGWLPPASPRDP